VNTIIDGDVSVGSLLEECGTTEDVGNAAAVDRPTATGDDGEEEEEAPLCIVLDHIQRQSIRLSSGVGGVLGALPLKRTGGVLVPGCAIRSEKFPAISRTPPAALRRRRSPRSSEDDACGAVPVREDEENDAEEARKRADENCRLLPGVAPTVTGFAIRGEVPLAGPG